MEKELRYLGEVLSHPEHPFVAVLGGAQVSDKIEVIQNLIPRVDRLLIGGAMAYTFFKAMGSRSARRSSRTTNSMRRRTSWPARKSAGCSSCSPSITSLPRSSKRGFRPRR